MKKVHISTVTAAILASLTLISEVSATDIASPAYVKSGDAGIPPALFLSYGSTNYWDMSGGPNNYRLYDHINDNPVFIINASVNDANSIVVGAAGDIGLANNALFIDRGSEMVGIGTTSPEDTLHIKSPNFGNLILEKEGQSKWKLGTTSTGGIALMDMQNSNTIPFLLEGNAPADSLHIRSNGNVGLGVGSPTVKLDVHGKIWNDDVIGSTWVGSNTVNDGLTTLVTLSADNTEVGKVSDTGFRLKNANVDFIWDFRTLETAEGFAATKLNTGGPEFRVDNLTSDHHNAKVSMGGVVVFENGQLQTPSSRALKTNIKPLDTQAALKAFHDLQPVSYAYKAHKDEPVVGFIAEDIPELVATKTRTGIDSTEILAVLTKVVQEQDIQLKAQAEKIAKLETMQKRLVKVESLLTNLALDTSNTKKEKVSLNTKP